MYERFTDRSNVIAVAGASPDKGKWGYMIYVKLKRSGFRVFALNPKEPEIDGDRSYADIGSLPEVPDVVVTVVRPEITEKVVKECLRAGIKMVWMQPGSGSGKAEDACRRKGIEVVNGPCYVADGLRESF